MALLALVDKRGDGLLEPGAEKRAPAVNEEELPAPRC